jgi:hypothetical protein
VTSRKNEFGKFDVETVVRTAVAVSGAGAEKTLAANVNQTVDTDRHQTTAVAQESTQSAGQIKTTRADKDEFGRYTNIVQTRTRNDLSLTGALVEKTPTVSSVGDVIDGAANPPAALAEGAYGSVDYRKDEFGRYVGQRIVRTYVATYIIWGETTGTAHSEEEPEYAHMYSPSAKRVRRFARTVTYSGTRNIRNSHSDAMAVIDGGKARSRVESHGSGRYLAIKITTITKGDWALDETGVT